MSFLHLENKNFLVTGVANKKSVAFHIGKILQEEGANVLYSVRSEERKKNGREIDGTRSSICM